MTQAGDARIAGLCRFECIFRAAGQGSARRNNNREETMRTYLILSTATALLVGGNAMAGGASYDFVQGGVMASRVNWYSTNETGTGPGVGGEVGITSFLYGLLDISRVTYSLEGREEQTFQPVSLGVGAHAALGAVDLFGALSLERLKYEVDLGGGCCGSTTYSGAGLTVGARGMVAGHVQWSGSLKYRDLDELKGAITLGVGGHYYFKPTMAVGLNLARTQYDEEHTLLGTELSLLFSFRYDFSSMR
jgi:hypothetical protein